MMIVPQSFLSSVFQGFSLLQSLLAEVVKLANTLRSGRSGRKLLRVQLPSSANLNPKLASIIWVSAKGGPAHGGQLPPSAILKSKNEGGN